MKPNKKCKCRAVHEIDVKARNEQKSSGKMNGMEFSVYKYWYDMPTLWHTKKEQQQPYSWNVNNEMTRAIEWMGLKGQTQAYIVYIWQ